MCENGWRFELHTWGVDVDGGVRTNYERNNRDMHSKWSKWSKPFKLSKLGLPAEMALKSLLCENGWRFELHTWWVDVDGGVRTNHEHKDRHICSNLLHMLKNVQNEQTEITAAAGD